MKESDWIRADERRPGKGECGPNRRIIVWHDFNGAMIASAEQLDENRFMRWWMPYPEAPEGAAHVLLDELKAMRGPEK